MKWHIVTYAKALKELTSLWQSPIAVDTETYGKVWDVENRKLLGISMSDGVEALYVPVEHFIEGKWERVLTDETKSILCSLFERFECIGHNFTYDKRWLHEFGFQTSWRGDTRLMWHLSSAPSGPRSYGLKDGQRELLGWLQSNEGELEANVKAKGGKLKDGDHYLADLDIMSKYACLDALSTYLIYQKLKTFFDSHNYWHKLTEMMEYNILLEQNNFEGVSVNREGLEAARLTLAKRCETSLKAFFKAVKPQIEELEQDWLDRKCATYKREYNKEHLKNRPDKWKRFNLNSDSDKRELFYGKLKFPVSEKTEGGLPSTSADVLKLYKGKLPAMEEYLKYEKANTLLSNFAGPYLDSLGSDNKLHPGFNICGTVSYRLSGFKPYLLNAPFDEKLIMQCLRVSEGYIGVHADLSAIEPTITAHFSNDPSLLKVFRDGLGDIYLDLALELFPTDRELHEGYNAHIPITKSVKQRFEKQRKVAKVIQLAVQYTGTGHTVSRNLTREGIPTTVAQADNYVRAYWRKFRKVAEFNVRIKEVNRLEGLLYNVCGRIIRVPDPDYKDLPNRFIQSSAHDVLVLWCGKIYRKAKEQGIHISPILLDCHDSTSNQVRVEDVERAKRIYQEALDEVNTELALSVTVKAETKTFTTLAGLKGDE